MFAALSSYYVCELYEFVQLYPHIMSVICTVRMCPVISSYSVCEMYECLQLSLHIMSVKCTNMSSCLFTLCLWNVRMCPVISSYYPCEMYECVQLSPHITPVKCMTLYSWRVVPHLILKSSWSTINVSCTSDQSYELSCRMRYACCKRL
jgi:hypothetical protein